MSEQQTPAASSPADVDVFQGQQPTIVEYNHFRETGEVPERFKPAEEPAGTAPADAPKQTVESEEQSETASESETEEEVQEPPQKVSPAEKRIKQLLAEKKELQRKLEAAAKTGAPPESPSAPAADQSPTPEDQNPDGTPKYKVYEDFIRAQARWEARQEIAEFQRKQTEQQALQALNAKFVESRSRYPDADSVILPAAKAMYDAQIPLAVKEVFSQSDYFIDLCYLVGSDPDELHNFFSLAQQNPRAALAKVFEYEKTIEQGLKGGKPSGTAPEKKQTQAPKPPAPVTGGSSRAFDVSDESLSTEEWARKRNAQLAKRG